MSETNDRNIPVYPILTVNFIGTPGLSPVLPFLIFLVVEYGEMRLSMVYSLLFMSFRLLFFEAVNRRAI
ncbi:hypothetical protein [Methanolobus halotolerans]|uniref:Uncharacterized protein n=1 Tax=Methanolobus halotolerans TaxID=2052935 RepID=A0A4E0PYT4_9EURY|nr:hypothetical protein [Methanolobus halotolerans]TGC11458.1 hypothetical protein CUN85_00870 [Methanolobus halotolerans]